MKNKQGQFIDGEEGKSYRFVKNDSRLIGNKLREGLKPANAFPINNVPHNFIGEIPRICNHSRDGKYKIITINETVIRTSRKKDYRTKRQISYAKYLWEKAHGQLPNRMVIVHLNRNKLDNSLDNLMAMTRAELLKFNLESD